MHIGTHFTRSFLLKPILNPLSLLYKSVAYLERRRRGKRLKKYPGLFIVSIDNLAFGGTGKTALIIHLGMALQRMNIPFAVVSRGYSSLLEKEGACVSADHRVEEVGDEAFLLKRYFPENEIYIGRNRARSLERVAEKGIQLVMLDDGFQSNHLQRDFCIMLMNPGHPYFYLRHFKMLAAESDLLLYLGEIPARTPHKRTARYTFHISRFRNREGEIVRVRQRSFFAFSALGDNGRFLKDLYDFHVKGFHFFPDHHAYSKKNLEMLESERKEAGADFLVCTEKDFVKISPAWINEQSFLYTQNEVQYSVDIIQFIIDHARQKGFFANIS